MGINTKKLIKHRMDYCAPSLSPDHIEINGELREIFMRISGHYSCISGYNYEDGSFRGATYDRCICLISGENIMQRGANLSKILAALREIWAKLHEPEWKEYYRKKYSLYYNYPVDIRMFYPGDTSAEPHEEYKYCLSVKELEFLIIVFDIYVKHDMYLLPEESPEKI